jgi:hypothetical protein
MIHGDFLIATAGLARSPAALGASGSILARIIVVQILLGGLLGIRVTSRTNLAPLNSDEAVIAIVLGGSLLCAVVLWPGPSALRKAALFGGLMLAAALWGPQVSLTEPQWPLMTRPRTGQRYYLIPILVWTSVVLTFAADHNRKLRYLALPLVGLVFVGVATDWSYPRLRATDFSEKAQEFADASAPERGWSLPRGPTYCVNDPGQARAMIGCTRPRRRGAGPVLIGARIGLYRNVWTD